MKTAVIFDLDGTLVDSLEDLATAMNLTLEHRGFPIHPVEAYKRLVGNGFRNLALLSLPEKARDTATVEIVHAEAASYYAKHCTDRTRPYAGVPQLLEALSAKKIPLAVLSNKPDELTRRVTSALFAAGSFAFVRGESELFPRKPDPASALDIAARLETQPSATLYLGDSDVDMATARAAGMVALGALWGFRGEAELRESGAKAVLAAPIELLSYL
jgi:phosphoglycolate phosphatase